MITIKVIINDQGQLQRQSNVYMEVKSTQSRQNLIPKSMIKNYVGLWW